MMLATMLTKRFELNLTWYEPRHGMGVRGNEVNPCVRVKATVNDCINMARTFSNRKLKDGTLLLAFISVHRACLVLGEESSAKY